MAKGTREELVTSTCHVWPILRSFSGTEGHEALYVFGWGNSGAMVPPEARMVWISKKDSAVVEAGGFLGGSLAWIHRGEIWLL
jgi:hypothetical protein